MEQMQYFDTYRGVVYPWHCDFNGHMNVMHYVGKFDEATWQFLAQLGIGPPYLKENNRIMVAVEQTFKYFRELFPGDPVYIRTELLEFREKAIVFNHQMYHAGNHILCAEGRMVGVHLDLETRKSVPFPDKIIKRRR